MASDDQKETVLPIIGSQETGAEAGDEQSLILPIIDSHVHMWRDGDLPKMNWFDPATSKLEGSRNLKQYKEAARGSPSLLGYVVLECDVRSDLDPDALEGAGWDLPLEELAGWVRVALGKPEEADGADVDDARLCLGILPWAPLPAGPEVMEKYIDRVKEVAGDAWPKIKGFRYLVQDKPHGVMIEEKFIESLKLLGRKGLVFDVGIDHHRRGRKQLDECLTMVDLAHEGVADDDRVAFIINHLCKPDLSICNIASDPFFNAWRTTIYALAKCSNTYMKLSGGFSEMPDTLKSQSASHIFQAIFGWLGVLLATFGPSRIMFGSDWPVCTFNGGEDAFARWTEVTEKMCWMASLSDEERAMIFGGTAKKAYNL